jgi:hypothetical protein
VKRWAWPTLPGFASRSGFDPFGYAPILHRVTEGRQCKLLAYCVSGFGKPFDKPFDKLRTKAQDKAQCKLLVYRVKTGTVLKRRNSPYF